MVYSNIEWTLVSNLGRIRNVHGWMKDYNNGCNRRKWKYRKFVWVTIERDLDDTVQRGFIFRSLLSSRNVKGNFGKRSLFIKRREQALEMGRYLGLVFNCCLTISLCSGISRFSSVSSLSNASDLVNTKNDCQKVSLKHVSFKLSWYIVDHGLLIWSYLTSNTFCNGRESFIVCA